MNHDVVGSFLCLIMSQNHVEVYFSVNFSMSLEIIIEQESEAPHL